MNRPFDAVAWMRRRRAEIEQEDGGLTWEERTKKAIERLRDDPLCCRLKDRVVSPTREPVAS